MILKFLSKQIKLILSILISLSLSYYYYSEITKRTRAITQQKLFIAATGIKYLLPDDYLKKAVLEGSVNDDEYDLVNESMNRFARDMEVEYVYAFVFQQGKFYFIANNITVTDLVINAENPFFQEYIPTNPVFREAATENKIKYANVVDKWGKFTSIIIPQKNPNGQIVLYCADIKMEELERGKFKEILISISILTLSFFIIHAFINTLYAILNKKRLPFRSLSIYISILCIIIGIIFSALFGYLFLNFNNDLFYSKTDSKIYLTAIAMDSILPEDFHDRVETMTKEEHQVSIDKLSRYANEVKIEYLYTMVEKDGKFFFAISSTNDKDAEKGTLTEFMEPWPQIEDAAREAFYSGQIIYRIELGTRWGDFRNIFIPIKKEFGRHYALGSDVPLDDIKGFQRKNLSLSILAGIFFFVFILSLLFEIIYSLVFGIGKFIRNDFISLKLKITFFISTVTLLSLTIVSYIFLVNGKKIIQAKTFEICKTLASNLGAIAREDLLIDTTYEATNKALSNIGRNDIEAINSVYIINAFGKYVADLTKTKKGQFAIDSEISYIQSLTEMDMREEFSIKTRKQFLKVTYPIFIEYNKKTIRIGAAVFEYDKDVLYKPVYEVQKIILYSGIILLLIIIFITYFLSDYVTKPLLYLTEGTKVIARGNLNYVLPVTSNDEVGILSKRFNEMSSNLKKSYDELEEKVIERTADLVKSQGTLITVLSNSPLILFSTDLNGIITLSEGQSLHLIGIRSGQAVGVSMYELFAHNPEALSAVQGALKGDGKILRIESLPFTFEVNFSPLYDINSEIIGLIALYFDVTQNLKAQEIIRIEKEKSDRLLLNILPEKIAIELKEKGFVKPVLYESVTVIFTDFKGFTKIASHMLPEDLLEKLDMIFLQFDQICERRNIEKLKTIGDAYMCAGGLPEINSTHPIDACLAAIEMQHFMNETKTIVEEISGEQFWDMRLGIHTGTVVAGVIGKTKFAYDVWGDAVNTASRMESNGSISKINISSSTYQHVKDFFECEYRGKIEAKNKGMIDMYFLLRIKTEFSRDDAGIIPNEKFLELYKKTTG